MEELKAKLWLLLAGLSGGFVGQFTSNEPLTTKQRLGFILSGIVTALFIIPWASGYFGLSTAEASSGLAFVAGIYWKQVVTKAGELVDLIKLPWSKKNVE